MIKLNILRAGLGGRPVGDQAENEEIEMAEESENDEPHGEDEDSIDFEYMDSKIFYAWENLIDHNEGKD